ncbi:MAG: hypothetical protein A2Z76_03305 [Chloroflexi bacterium RBG_13_56_8b]|nr:MAG: hypothetical protein A2Z76_03305 [Chloroflexi bacterium RBG_13_56_8b]
MVRGMSYRSLALGGDWIPAFAGMTVYSIQRDCFVVLQLEESLTEGLSRNDSGGKKDLRDYKIPLYLPLLKGEVL